MSIRLIMIGCYINFTRGFTFTTSNDPISAPSINMNRCGMTCCIGAATRAMVDGGGTGSHPRRRDESNRIEHRVGHVLAAVRMDDPEIVRGEE